MSGEVRDGYVARWHGTEYDASPDGEEIRLYRSEPGDGFEEIRPGHYRQIVPLSEVDSLEYVRTTCEWKGEPFLALAEHESWLRVEYTGGRAPVAHAIGLEEFDYGVYQGWAPRSEVVNLRQYRV